MLKYADADVQWKQQVKVILGLFVFRFVLFMFVSHVEDAPLHWVCFPSRQSSQHAGEVLARCSVRPHTEQLDANELPAVRPPHTGIISSPSLTHKEIPDKHGANLFLCVCSVRQMTTLFPDLNLLHASAIIMDLQWESALEKGLFFFFSSFLSWIHLSVQICIHKRRPISIRSLTRNKTDTE